MGGGGGAPTKQEVTSTTTNLPAYAEPYVTDVMQQAQALTSPQNAYVPYEGQRIAEFTPQQQQVQQNIAGLQTPGQFGVGSQLAQQAGLGSIAASQYNPGQFGYQQIGQPNLQQFSMQTPQAFGQVQADQYMSPYAQSVMDVQKREAVRDAQKGQLVQDLGAARQGTYGGSRQLLAGMERERNLGMQLGDIEAKGMQAAYENAQSQYERDRAAQMQAGGQNLQAALGVQQLGTQTGLQALQANQQAGLDTQKMAEQSRQFGSQQALAGYGQAGQMAQTLANLGTAQSQADISQLGLQSQTAQQQQALDQQQLSQQYQDFLTQRAYPMEQLSFYNDIIRGLPIAPGQTTAIYGQTPSAVSQIGGLGLGALGMYNMAKG